LADLWTLIFAQNPTGAVLQKYILDFL